MNFLEDGGQIGEIGLRKHLITISLRIQNDNGAHHMLLDKDGG